MPWQVQEEILRAKSYLTIHKMTRKSLDIESAIEALELAYNRLDDNDFENNSEFSSPNSSEVVNLVQSYLREGKLPCCVYFLFSVYSLFILDTKSNKIDIWNLYFIDQKYVKSHNILTLGSFQ